MSVSSLTRAELYERLDAIRSRMGVSLTEPADPFLLARQHGCRVALRRFEGNVGGMLMLTPDGPLVLLNAARPALSRRFSMAHELIHLWLHPAAVPGTPPDPERERQANAGAAELLIPRRGLEKLLREHPGRPESELIALTVCRFEVSETQARYRLKEVLKS